MNFVRRTMARCLVAAAALAGAAPGFALSIEGLSPLAPLTLHDVSASVMQERLIIHYPGGQLRIGPWPEFLPAKLEDQFLQAERQIWPAGPSDRVSFTRQGERQPWLVLGSRSRPETPVLGEWNIRRGAVGWYLSNGKHAAAFGANAAIGEPVRILVCGKPWLVYLLEESKEARVEGLSNEREARMSWAAVREPTGRRQPNPGDRLPDSNTN